MEIADLLSRASAFKQKIREARRSVPAPDFEWYPHDTMSALWHMDKLLTGANRNLLDGKLRILDLGDLTWDKEMELVCPVDKLGPVDIYIVSHHGSSQSNSPALLNGITPRVAIMDNGATKGGSRSSWNIIEKSPRLEDLWQLHFSSKGGTAHNVASPEMLYVSGSSGAQFDERAQELRGTSDLISAISAGAST